MLSSFSSSRARASARAAGEFSHEGSSGRDTRGGRSPNGPAVSSSGSATCSPGSPASSRVGCPLRCARRFVRGTPARVSSRERLNCETRAFWSDFMQCLTEFLIRVDALLLAKRYILIYIRLSCTKNHRERVWILMIVHDRRKIALFTGQRALPRDLSMARSHTDRQSKISLRLNQ